MLTATIPILLVMRARARELLHFAQLDKAPQWGRAYCLLGKLCLLRKMLKKKKSRQGPFEWTIMVNYF